MTEIKHLRWLMFKGWWKDNAGTFPGIVLWLIACYLIACMLHGGWLIGPRIFNIILGLFAIILLVVSLILWFLGWATSSDG